MEPERSLPYSLELRNYSYLESMNRSTFFHAVYLHTFVFNITPSVLQFSNQCLHL